VNGAVKIIDEKNKVVENDTHIFFLNGPFSQWYPCNFSARLNSDTALLHFNCAEQYMMASKAHLFEDHDTLDAIMNVHQQRDWRNAPKQQKELGRRVVNFDASVWDNECRDIVFHGNLAKFKQNEALAQVLKSSGQKVIVEGAWYDQVWGVGLAWDDPLIFDPANWRGKNLLGEALMKVRDRLV
jgi:ribA/ribD-fused uncharacterized protein